MPQLLEDSWHVEGLLWHFKYAMRRLNLEMVQDEDKKQRIFLSSLQNEDVSPLLPFVSRHFIDQALHLLQGSS